MSLALIRHWGIYSTIVLRDVLQRNPQINQNTLHRVMLFLSFNAESTTYDGIKLINIIDWLLS